MSTVGVLPFIRGIDFSRNDFQEDDFPKIVSQMSGLKWLKLNKTNIDWVPEELGSLTKLESLSMIKNNLVTLHGEIMGMNCLKYLNVRENRLKDSGLPSQIFKLKELLVLDLSRNNLKEVPPDLEKTKSLLVLNLSSNQIESVPNQLFVNLISLMFLDLSSNKLETLPPQLRRLVNLQTLNLNNNPLGHNQLRQLPSLVNLRVLNLRNTQRNLQNMPTSLDHLIHLSDVDLSHNNLDSVPIVLTTIPNLRRINLSDNNISSLDANIGDVWKNLENLNISRNRLKSLPASICKLYKLRRLFISYNEIDFDGIPSGIGKLSALEVFVASNNNLETIPEGVVRCGRLKKLNLAHNRLITLPEAIHLLNDLELLDLSDNPDLIMPPKPPEYLNYSKGSGIEYYNIDFSLKNQLRLAGAGASNNLLASPTSPSKDPIARKMRLRRRHRNPEEDDLNQAKVLKGMSKLAQDKHEDLTNNTDSNLKPKRWEDTLEKPSLDYSDIFDDDVGQELGLCIWEIENFLPSVIDNELHGKFYEADCYIILKTEEDETQNPDWKIFYWIGSAASLDKKACSAIHAVNLRNFLGAQCRTVREEQGEESAEFLSLFPDGIMYIEGGRTTSGFSTVEEAEVIHRMYRLHELSNKQRQLYLETVPLKVNTLDPRFVFVLDAGWIIYVWNGDKSKNTMRQKARLLAEKINKEERKNKAEIVFCNQGDEISDFWNELEGYDEGFQIEEHVDIENFKPIYPKLYQVELGMGYLELPQVPFREGALKISLLESKRVYILDCNSDLFVWLGQKSARLVKAAAVKLVQELYDMIKRPEFALITRCLQGNEPQVFKSKFTCWDDVIAVDFTRTAESVARTGANLHEWMSKQEVKVDTLSLFMPRQKPMSREEEDKLINEWNQELLGIEGFVLEGKKSIKLSEIELGHFYSEDCYVFLCKYSLPPEKKDEKEEDDDEEDKMGDFHLICYFWQGRDASNMGWLTFTFDLLKKYQKHFGDKLDFVKIFQQQEIYKFMSHFQGEFVIHLGKKPGKNCEAQKDIELFYLRSNGSRMATRCIEVIPDASVLCSGFCYILWIKYKHIAYVWIGNSACDEDIQVIERIALKMYDNVEMINEGEEPEDFWQALGGKKEYETDTSFMNYTRLFRCSNDKGYFSVSEKCIDFCQDDLSQEDIMILDNGENVFVWVGNRCSDVEIKLGLKSAGVYVANCKLKGEKRQLMLTFSGKETRKFTKCFHGWMKANRKVDARNEYLMRNGEAK